MSIIIIGIIIGAVCLGIYFPRQRRNVTPVSRTFESAANAEARQFFLSLV